MRSSISQIALSVAIAAVCLQAGAQQRQQGEYWDRTKNGWHFYEPKPQKPKPKVEPELPAPSAPPVEMAPMPAPIPQGPAPLSADWLKENLPKYQSRAIDDPSPQNVELVAYLQRFAMDKSERYAQAMQQVVITNPTLDEYARSPITAAQRMEAERSISATKRQTLAYLSTRVGLWYFYSSTCPYCRRQEPILDRLEQQTGLSIFPISLDGGPLASGSPRSFVVNQGHAEQLGVMTTPTLVIADTATGQLYNLAAGLRTNSEIEDRLLQLAKMNQWISEAQYDEAVRGEPRMFLTDGQINTQELQDDPNALLEALRRASYNGGSTPWRIPQAQQ